MDIRPAKYWTQRIAILTQLPEFVLAMSLVLQIKSVFL